MRPGLWLLWLVLAGPWFRGPALAAHYTVGPREIHTNLQSVAALLRAGDVVELLGGATFPGDVRLNASGTADAPIIIRGKVVDGRRPVLAGVRGEEAAVVRVSGDYYLLEDLEITGGGDALATRGLRNVGHGTVVRRVAVREVAGHGILNSDAAGSLTLSQVEVSGCGRGELHHQIYIGMNLEKYPQAVFRLEHSHVHAGRGGNNVKVRAGRSEIYYNWLEGAWGRELELLGPDRQGLPAAAVPTRRCDADVVGNVLHKSAGVQASAVRVGGDGSGTSHGRARFVHNTILMNPALGNPGVFKLQDAFEALEVCNTVFYAFGKPLRLLYDPGLKYQSAGAGNWVPRGATHLPRHWRGTVQGLHPGFADAQVGDWRPAANSPLRLSGAALAREVPQPLFEPARLAGQNFEAWHRRATSRPLEIGALGVEGSERQ